jgi:diguanylate cyclase (GGDEF)-like protein
VAEHPSRCHSPITLLDPAFNLSDIVADRKWSGSDRAEGQLGLRAKGWIYVPILSLGVLAWYIELPSRERQSAVLLAFGLASVVGMLIGICIHRPSDRPSWLLLAAGAVSFMFGEFLEDHSGHVPSGGGLTQSGANVLILMGYLLVIASVIRLGRNPNHSGHREDYADAAIISLGGLAISWNFLMNSYIHDVSLTTPAKLALLAHPILDVVLIFVVLRSLVFGAAGLPYHRVIVGAVLGMASADFANRLVMLHHSNSSSYILVGTVLATYALFGVAGLDPSIAEEVFVVPKQAPSVYRPETTGRSRLPIVALAGFIPAYILLISSSLGKPIDVPVMSSLCVSVFALILMRMMWLIERITRQTKEIEVHARALEASHRQRDTLEAELRHMAFNDELTGLANRTLLHDRVEQALAAAPRSGRSVALCFGDLDGFKTVNDTLGHHVGDSVLLRASRLISSIVRPGDTVARLGGDEFAILMVDVEHQEAAVDFAQRVVSVLSDAPDFEGNQIGLSISVGVALSQPGKTTDQLLTEADSAMYEAKEDGKNCVRVFQSSMRSRMFERLDLTNGFRWALGRSEFILNYQPIFSLSDNRLRGFEALVRWNHPTLGEVEPLRFIPMAEETGFIVPLGRWILVEACEQLAAWNNDSDGDLTLSVNLSRRQLTSPNLVDEIRTAVALSNVDPRQLILEVTENVLMKEPERAARVLSELREFGIRIAVDDFGTGYSSLSHLQRFPVDVIKIDKSFIDPLVQSNSKSVAMVTSIMGLAKSLGLEVIAEGIEHESQLQRLVDLGCNLGQGFLMAHPLDQEAALAAIAQNSKVALLN